MGHIYSSFQHHNANFENRPDHAECTWKRIGACETECCSEHRLFDASTAYLENEELNYNGECFKAKWWTQNRTDFPAEIPPPSNYWGPFSWQYSCGSVPEPTCSCDPAFEYIKRRDSGLNQ